MTAYIPQISSNVSPYPFIACNVDGIKDSDLFAWEDPHRSYKYYDLTKDVRKLLLEPEDDDDDEATTFEFDSHRVFSKMEHWEFSQSSQNL